jgi:YD repeat-containing protein
MRSATRSVLTVKNRPGDPNIAFLYDIAGRIYDVNDAGDITEYYYDRIGRISDVNDPEDRLASLVVLTVFFVFALVLGVQADL